MDIEGNKKWGTFELPETDLVEEDDVDFLVLFLRARFFCLQWKRI
jgi:hypothetical protein